MKISIAILSLSFLICSCNQTEVLKNEKIEKGILHNELNGVETELDSEELKSLNILLKKGISPTKGMKWQGWKYIKVTYDDQKQEIISLFEEGYLNLERNNRYYKIKRAYMKMFREITKGEEGIRAKPE
jgi:hypothetical protein